MVKLGESVTTRAWRDLGLQGGAGVEGRREVCRREAAVLDDHEHGQGQDHAGHDGGGDPGRGAGAANGALVEGDGDMPHADPDQKGDERSREVGVVVVELRQDEEEHHHRGPGGKHVPLHEAQVASSQHEDHEHHHPEGGQHRDGGSRPGMEHREPSKAADAEQSLRDGQCREGGAFPQLAHEHLMGIGARGGDGEGQRGEDETNHQGNGEADAAKGQDDIKEREDHGHDGPDLHGPRQAEEHAPNHQTGSARGPLAGEDGEEPEQTEEDGERFEHEALAGRHCQREDRQGEPGGDHPGSPPEAEAPGGQGGVHRHHQCGDAAGNSHGVGAADGPLQGGDRRKDQRAPGRIGEGEVPVGQVPVHQTERCPQVHAVAVAMHADEHVVQGQAVAGETNGDQPAEHGDDPVAVEDAADARAG